MNATTIIISFFSSIIAIVALFFSVWLPPYLDKNNKKEKEYELFTKFWIYLNAVSRNVRKARIKKNGLWTNQGGLSQSTSQFNLIASELAIFNILSRKNLEIKNLKIYSKGDFFDAITGIRNLTILHEEFKLEVIKKIQKENDWKHARKFELYFWTAKYKSTLLRTIENLRFFPSEMNKGFISILKTIIKDNKKLK